MLKRILNFFKSLWNKLFGASTPTTPSTGGGGGGGGRPSETHNDSV